MKDQILAYLKTTYTVSQKAVEAVVTEFATIDKDTKLVSFHAPKFVSKVDNLIRITINDSSPTEESALFIFGFVPGKCPFAKELTLPLLNKVIRFPALCTLNPYYEEVVNLRIRAVDLLLSKYGYALVNGDLTKAIVPIPAPAVEPVAIEVSTGLK